MQPVPQRHSKPNQFPQRLYEFSRGYQALLQSGAAATPQGFPELLKELSKLLHAVFDFDFVVYALHDPDADLIDHYIVGLNAEFPRETVKLPASDSPEGWVWSNQLPLVISDFHSEGRFPKALEVYAKSGMGSLVTLPLTTSKNHFGAISFALRSASEYEGTLVHTLERLANLAAIVLANALHRQALAGEEEQLRALTALSIQISKRSIKAHESLKHERTRLETVLEINAALAITKLDVSQMLPAISDRLAKAVAHDAAVVSLWDEKQDSAFVLSKGHNGQPLFLEQGSRISSDQLFTMRLLRDHKQGTIVRRTELEAAAGQFETVRRALDQGLVSWCVVPMRTGEKLAGVLYLGDRRDDAFTDNDLQLLRQVGQVLAQFLENALTHEALQREKKDLEKIIEAGRSLTSVLDRSTLLEEISNCIRSVFEQDYAYLALYNPRDDSMHLHMLGSGIERCTTAEETAPVSECPSGVALRRGEPVVFTVSDLEQMPGHAAKVLLGAGVRTLCCIPLVLGGTKIGVVCIGSKREQAFSESTIEMLGRMAPQIAVALENSRTYFEVTSLRDRLTKEKKYLEQEIRDTLDFEDIVGQSPALLHVLDQVKTVSPSDATVLILGETGTGKELIARAIHRLSCRAGENFVKVNCAAIPTGLLESELFGHEKGAFTGAISQKVGRLELADKGTLLLDEVGEIPLELQPKLLRALQDHEFERLGGTKTIRVNVRIIAATNRDLSDAVSKHQFRSDLFYRLHVFPISLPALRERSQDIPLLVHHFIRKFAKQSNKHIETIPESAMAALTNWHWPGNIRELENFIERSVILSESGSLRVPVGELCPAADICSRAGREARNSQNGNTATLEELERQYIIQVLRQVGGVISGSGGAAAKLGMKRTTLQSKILRLGITRDDYDDELPLQS